jgi:hypothetical protein
MSSDASSAPQDPTWEIAVKIYVQLIANQVVIADNNVKMASNPESLAKLSFTLAEAFQKVDKATKLAAKPEFVAFDVNKMDFG